MDTEPTCWLFCIVQIVFNKGSNSWAEAIITTCSIKYSSFMPPHLLKQHGNNCLTTWLDVCIFHWWRIVYALTRVLHLLEMHLIAISFCRGRLTDSTFTLTFTWKPTHSVKCKKGAGRNVDKGEGVAGEPCLQGSYQSSDGIAMRTNAACSPVAGAHACVEIHICIPDI